MPQHRRSNFLLKYMVECFGNMTTNSLRVGRIQDEPTIGNPKQFTELVNHLTQIQGARNNFLSILPMGLKYIECKSLLFGS